jgi:hypothetical protein
MRQRESGCKAWLAAQGGRPQREAADDIVAACPVATGVHHLDFAQPITAQMRRIGFDAKRREDGEA